MENGKASIADWGELRVGDSRRPNFSLTNWTVKGKGRSVQFSDMLWSGMGITGLNL